MKKYIDAEKLKGFVEELKKRAQRNCCDTWGIVPDALEEVEALITSLQQEQPECSSSLVDFESTSADIKLRTCDKTEMEKLYGEEY